MAEKVGDYFTLRGDTAQGLVQVAEISVQESSVCRFVSKSLLLRFRVHNRLAEEWLMGEAK